MENQTTAEERSTGTPGALRDQRSAEAPVTRLISLVTTLSDAAPRGLTKAELCELIQDYSGTSRASFERKFERDKETLRRLGVPLRTLTAAGEELQGTAAARSSGDHEARYAIEPEDYSLEGIELSGGELLALQRAQRLWTGSGLEETVGRAVSAMTGARQAPEATSADVRVSQYRLGTAHDLQRLSELHQLGHQPLVEFTYSPLRGPSLQTRTAIVLRVKRRLGHWYLIAHDFERAALRVFRLDRIHGSIRARNAGSLGGQEQELLDEIRRGERYTDLEVDTEHRLERLSDREYQEQRLLSVREAHSEPEVVVPKLRAVRRDDHRGGVDSAVKRLLDMTAYLYGQGGASRQELQSQFSRSAQDLHQDLLNLQMSGSFADRYGFSEYIEISPAISPSFEEFTQEVGENTVITIDVPSEVITRRLRLAVPEALSLDIALRALLASDAPRDQMLRADAESLSHKIGSILPRETLPEHDVDITWDYPDPQGYSATIRSAIGHEHSLWIAYRSATRPEATGRTVEPVELMISGEHAYLRAWCREAVEERFFRLDRIDSLKVLTDEPVGRQAMKARQQLADPPRVPRHEARLEVVLHFAAPVAAQADQYMPIRETRHEDGSRTIQTGLRSAQVAIELCMGAAGLVTVLSPSSLRAEVVRAAEDALEELGRWSTLEG